MRVVGAGLSDQSPLTQNLLARNSIPAPVQGRTINYREKTTLAATKITVKNNGSVRIEGEFEICDQDGNAFDLGGRSVISLCRCGQSSNKPFCDGSHKRLGFQSEVKAFALPPITPTPPSA
jgi:CDGSH-type Zn-finger protein